MAIQRIATVKATGDRYLVVRMDLRTNKVYTWGEVYSFKTGRGHTRAEQFATGASTTHGPGKVFLRDAVELSEVDVTGAVAEELLAQTRRNDARVIGVQSRQVRK